ncbi:TniQ family protein [Mycobacteroides abscessus]|uniref:TniQ family protein n=1 Tax=Mycobacteroides abscessus TaxID=36809 RepID=UPI000E68C2D9|nr:TniQ family protein [Mycobacteroides abscessus]RIR87689.1 hypothetical protein D2E66_09150 [Mycobacteroides abscessus]RIS59242.1 hypothetical protein D2E46_07915 [Mycobacteroides abscessus]
MNDANGRTFHRLPLTTSPIHNELIASYLARLEHCNTLDTRTLERAITASPLRIADALAQLAGTTKTQLATALPELRLPVDNLPRSARLKILGFDGIAIACQRCVAIKPGDTPFARQWSHNHDTICHQHNRWTGSPATPGTGQIDLTDLPQILAASHRHHAIARRHGQRVTSSAFLQAAALIDQWHSALLLPQIDARAADLATKTRHQGKTKSAAEQACRYPEIVAATAHLADTEWLRDATRSPARAAQALQQIQAVVAIPGGQLLTSQQSAEWIHRLLRGALIEIDPPPRLPPRNARFIPRRTQFEAQPRRESAEDIPSTVYRNGRATR